MSKPNAYRRLYGQYFTPTPVIHCCYALMAGLLPAQATIVDPACGDGAFLRFAATHGLADRQQLYGCDVDAELISVLSADGLPHTYHADGLQSDRLAAGGFDLAIGNPPYGIAIAHEGGRPLSSEVRFLLRSIELTRAGGLIALVLPNGVLSNERLQALRADLLERCSLLAVIELPRQTFRHTGTAAACSIVLLRNAPAPAGHRSFYAIAASLADLDDIISAYRQGPCAAGAVAGGPQTICFWMTQSSLLAQRMDAHFWRPDFSEILDRMGARHALRPLGELIGRDSLLVGDHVRVSRGEAKGQGLPYEYYQTREFMPAGYNYAAIEHCDERAYRRLQHTAVRHADILVSCAGLGGAGQGRICLITHRPGPSCTGDVFIIRAAQLRPIFLFLFLGSQCGRSQLLRLQNGVGTVNLSTNELLQVQVPLLDGAYERGYTLRYAAISRAHHTAMRALQQSNTGGFAQASARAAERLAGLRSELEAQLLAD